MSSPEFSSEENSPTSPWQRIAIGAGVLIVVALTVVAAIFLAVQDVPGQPTVVSVASLTVMATATPKVIVPATPTVAAARPTNTPSATPIAPPTATPPPLAEPPTATLPPPAATTTFTPLPPPPTATPPPPPTATPAPPPPTPTPGGGACQPPASWVSYVTQVGDTLNSLAERTNVSVYDLQKVNCLDSFTILPGQTIYLPFTPPTPTVTNTPTAEPPTPTATRTGTPTPTPAPPEIYSNEPTQGVNSADVIMAVLGRNFRPDDKGFRVELRNGSSRQGLNLGELRTSTSFEATIPAGLAPGTYDLWVINPDDQFDTQRSAYTTLLPTPTP